MERLTFEGNFCDIAQCKEIPCPYNGECSQRKVWERLKAYEDKVKTPEEVLPKDKADEIALKLMRLADLESLCSYTRLRELAEADRAGRLVVLPFSDADDVEMRRDGITYKSDHWNILLTAFADDYPTLSGRKLGVFSVKEAEKALEAKKNE